MCLKINDQVVHATHYMWDGCHKFYLIETTFDLEVVLAKGWSVKDIYPVSSLPMAWSLSCPLRFISTAADLKDVVPQCEDATVEWVTA